MCKKIDFARFYDFYCIFWHLSVHRNLRCINEIKSFKEIKCNSSLNWKRKKGGIQKEFCFFQIL